MNAAGQSEIAQRHGELKPSWQVRHHHAERFAPAAAPHAAA